MGTNRQKLGIADWDYLRLRGGEGTLVMWGSRVGVKLALRDHLKAGKSTWVTMGEPGT